jgi:hypothetical protein
VSLSAESLSFDRKSLFLRAIFNLLSRQLSMKNWILSGKSRSKIEPALMPLQTSSFMCSRCFLRPISILSAWGYFLSTKGKPNSAPPGTTTDWHVLCNRKKHDSNAQNWKTFQKTKTLGPTTKRPAQPNSISESHTPHNISSRFVTTFRCFSSDWLKLDA